MTHEEFVAGVRALLAELDKSAEPQAPTVLRVPSGGSVQAALATATPVIELEPHGEYGGFMVSRPVRINCHGAHIHGDGVPAIHVLPGPTSTDIGITQPVCSSTFQVPIQLGDNGPTQVRLEDVPRRIALIEPVILAHNHAQAKNGIENNAIDVEIIDGVIQQVFSPTGVESHGLITINTPGGLTVRGGIYDGASTPLFTGGDAIDLPGTDIADIVYTNLTITRPASWKTDGVNRNIKNLIEFKNVSHARIENCQLSNCWGPVQRGFAVMLTPKVDGRVVDVEFRNNTITNVGGGFNITGKNPTGLDPTRTDDIRIIGNTVTIDKTSCGPGATGWFLLITGGPGRILVEGNNIQHNGNAFVYVDDTTRIGSLIVRNNTFNAGAYGIRTPAGNNGVGWEQVFDELSVSGNRISGASAAFKKSFPDNEWIG